MAAKNNSPSERAKPAKRESAARERASDRAMTTQDTSEYTHGHAVSYTANSVDGEGTSCTGRTEDVLDSNAGMAFSTPSEFWRRPLRDANEFRRALSEACTCVSEYVSMVRTAGSTSNYIKNCYSPFNESNPRSTCDELRTPT
ncbi:uncharacterized protein LOC111262337 isoform X12 [Varroa jacobsoni]|uniref:uncharacterized protein LOC111262337 isoform X12 n=1 Tax=Varroa jacobsoni TaxID=62625 RepID=UPI000BF5A477|nr:uncharacterized protein LOC111262337 isoform X12 [Varroa jacobsoni]